jgi:hypothetical protein
MFSPNSRYARCAAYQATTADGRQVLAVRPPVPQAAGLAGYHRRIAGERLDLIAARHIADATRFWALCDVNNAMVPDALAARELVGIPRGGRSG